MPAKKNSVVEYFSGSQALTGRVLTGAVVGSTFVNVAADTANQYDADRTFPIETAAAGSLPLGVAAWDRSATDENNPNTVAVYRTGILSVTASAAIAQGASVSVAADGKVITAAPDAVVVGKCLRACAATPTDSRAMIALNI